MQPACMGCSFSEANSFRGRTAGFRYGHHRIHRASQPAERSRDMLRSAVSSAAELLLRSESFAEKSAEQLHLSHGFRPDFPRNFATTRGNRDVPIGSPKKEPRGRERETDRSIDAATFRTCRNPLPPRARQRAAITVRYWRQLAGDIRLGNRNPDRDSRGDRCGDCSGRRPNQLGMGRRLHCGDCSDLRFTAGRCVDSRHVRRVGRRT